MAESYERHDMSDELWSLIESHTIGTKKLYSTQSGHRFQ